MVRSVRSSALAAGALFLMLNPHATKIACAQTPADTLEVLIDHGDSSLWSRIQDLDWEGSTRWRTRWSRSPPSSGSPLGRLYGLQSRLSIRSKHWTFLSMIDKDPGEPWGPSRNVTWTGPEMKRIGLGWRRDRSELIMGDLRLDSGLRLASGWAVSLVPALSNPLYQPSGIVRARPYGGGTALPVRRGLLLSTSTEKGGLQGWYTLSRPPASLSRSESGFPEIRNPSTADSFISRSAVSRRRGLALSGSGGGIWLQRAHWSVGATAEHLRFRSAMSENNHLVPIGGSSHVFVSGIHGAGAVGAVRVIAETARVGTTSMSGIRIRWRTITGSGIASSITSISGRSRSPFGMGARMASSWDEERHASISGRWVHGVHRTSLFLYSRMRRADMVSTSHRFGIQYDRQSGRWVTSVFVRTNHSREWTVGSGEHLTRHSTVRMGIRHAARISHALNSTVQIQGASRRRDSDPEALSGILATTLEWKKRMWTWKGMLAGRISESGASALYVSYPAVSGTFPVLGGATRGVFMVNLVRFAWSDAMRLEAWWRMDSITDQRSMKSRSHRWVIQLTRSMTAT